MNAEVVSVSHWLDENQGNNKKKKKNYWKEFFSNSILSFKVKFCENYKILRIKSVEKRQNFVNKMTMMMMSHLRR